MKLKESKIKSTWVLGSTSEVARSICRELADSGCMKFHLLARNPIDNQSFADELEQRYGVIVSCQQINLLLDSQINNGMVADVGDFDLYLVTAGSLGDAVLARVDVEEALSISAANYTGLIRWITSITKPERLNKLSRLWVFSSVAADLSRPSNYHYGAAKAALTSLCEGLLLRCYHKPFAVRIIKAGFINTKMTVGKTPAALTVSTRSVAIDLLRHPNRRGIEYLPWWWAPLMFVVRLFPAALVSKL